MYLVKMDCGHVAEVKAVDTNTVVPAVKCVACNRWRDVLHWTRDEWHTRCNRCSYSRSHGQAKVYAERAAKVHEARHPSHHVSLLYYNRAKGSILPTDIVSDTPSLFDMPIPDVLGEPPF